MVLRAARGFSLLELTLVIAIIGVLLGVVAVSVGGMGNKAKVRATEASMSTIKSALDSYNLEYSAFPPDLRTLAVTKILDASKPLKDGWKRDFQYDPRGRSKEQPYILMSAGEDGVAGNEDDIDLWQVLQK
jgi:general secretion pathway protein G